MRETNNGRVVAAVIVVVIVASISNLVLVVVKIVSRVAEVVAVGVFAFVDKVIVVVTGEKEALVISGFKIHVGRGGRGMDSWMLLQVVRLRDKVRIIIVPSRWMRRRSRRRRKS